MAAIEKKNTKLIKEDVIEEKEVLDNSNEQLKEELKVLREELREMKRTIPEAPTTDVDRAVEDFAMKVKRQCELEVKVPLTIPFNEANPDDDIVEINISGYKWQIRRGEETMVPKSIAEAYNDSFRRTVAAARGLKFDTKNPVMIL